MSSLSEARERLARIEGYLGSTHRCEGDPVVSPGDVCLRRDCGGPFGCWPHCGEGLHLWIGLTSGASPGLLVVASVCVEARDGPGSTPVGGMARTSVSSDPDRVDALQIDQLQPV